jgi:hypothetical protein
MVVDVTVANGVDRVRLRGGAYRRRVGMLEGEAQKEEVCRREQ